MIETLDLAKYRVKSGALLNYWLTVRDNKEPSSNRTETAHQTIEVTEPVSAPEKKKIEDSQQKERDQLEPTSSNSDGESSADKPPQPQPGKNGEENSDSGKGGPPQDENQKPQNGNDQGSAGTGSVDESNPDNKAGGANNNSPQLSPEDQRMAEKLKSLLNNKNASNPPSDQQNPADAQPKNANSPSGNSGNAGASQNNGNSKDRPQNSGGARPNNSQRPAAEIQVSRSRELPRHSPVMPTRMTRRIRSSERNATAINARARTGRRGTTTPTRIPKLRRTAIRPNRAATGTTLSIRLPGIKGQGTRATRREIVRVHRSRAGTTTKPMVPTPKRAAARTPAIKAQARIRVTRPVITRSPATTTQLQQTEWRFCRHEKTSWAS